MLKGVDLELGGNEPEAHRRLDSTVPVAACRRSACRLL
jgi:hypothetical protein